MNLYNISTEYLKLRNELIESMGELTPELETALTINQEDLEKKGLAYGFIIKNIDNDIATIDSEIERLTLLKKSRNNAIDRLKNTLKTAMELFEITKIESPLLKISFLKSKSVEVLDLKLLDAKYKKTSTPEPVTTADKKLIKEAIEAGETVTGAKLNYNNNIQIK